MEKPLVELLPSNDLVLPEVIKNQRVIDIAELTGWVKADGSSLESLTKGKYAQEAITFRLQDKGMDYVVKLFNFAKINPESNKEILERLGWDPQSIDRNIQFRKEHAEIDDRDTIYGACIGHELANFVSPKSANKVDFLIIDDGEPVGIIYKHVNGVSRELTPDVMSKLGESVEHMSMLGVSVDGMMGTENCIEEPNGNIVLIDLNIGDQQILKKDPRLLRTGEYAIAREDGADGPFDVGIKSLRMHVMSVDELMDCLKLISDRQNNRLEYNIESVMSGNILITSPERLAETRFLSECLGRLASQANTPAKISIDLWGDELTIIAFDDDNQSTEYTAEIGKIDSFRVAN